MKPAIMFASAITFTSAPTIRATPEAAIEVKINVSRNTKNVDASSSSPKYTHIWVL